MRASRAEDETLGDARGAAARGARKTRNPRATDRGPVAGVSNYLLDHYTATQYNYAVIGDDLRMTVVLLHESVLRMMQIAQPGPKRPN